MSKPFRVRASSWGRLFDCAHAWEGTNIMGLRSPSSPRAALGTAIHAGTATFDAARILGSDVTVADACDVCAQTIADPREEINWRAEPDFTLKKAMQIGVILTQRYCLEVSPRYTFRAVEQETKPLVIDCGGGVLIELTGTLDRSRLVAGAAGPGIADLKSGRNAVQDGRARTRGHTAQIGTYEILYEHTNGEAITEPAEIIGLKTSGTPEVATGEIHNAKQIMLGTEEEPGLIQYAAAMFRTGLFPPNPASTLCSETYCPRWHRCKFHY